MTALILSLILVSGSPKTINSYNPKLEGHFPHTGSVRIQKQIKKPIKKKSKKIYKAIPSQFDQYLKKTKSVKK